jgi:hypothetical protein
MAAADYPYVSGTSGDSEECMYDPSKAVVSLSGYNTLPTNDHDAVMTHLAEVILLYTQSYYLDSS